MARIGRRAAAFPRRTRGTEIDVEFKLDGAGRSEVDSPFEALNMLLEMMSGHGQMDLRLRLKVNDRADDTYALDDMASAVAEALRRALGNRPKVRQFGTEILAVGDTLVMVSIDVVSTPVFRSNLTWQKSKVDGVPTATIDRFLRTFVDRLGASLHIHEFAGDNDANKVRAVFLALGGALCQAAEPVDRDGAREVAAAIDYDDDEDYAGEPPAEVVAEEGGSEAEPGASEADSEGRQNGRRRRRGRRGGRRRRGREDASPEDAEPGEAEAAREPVEAHSLHEPTESFPDDAPEVNDSDDPDDKDAPPARARRRRGGRGRARARQTGGEGAVDVLTDSEGDSASPVLDFVTQAEGESDARARGGRFGRRR